MYNNSSYSVLFYSIFYIFYSLFIDCRHLCILHSTVSVVSVSVFLYICWNYRFCDKKKNYIICCICLTHFYRLRRSPTFWQTEAFVCFNELGVHSFITLCNWPLFSAFKTFKGRNTFDYNNAVEAVSSHPVSEETVWNVSRNNKALLYRTRWLEQNRPESCSLLELKIIYMTIFHCPLKIRFLLSFGVWILGV